MLLGADVPAMDLSVDAERPVVTLAPVNSRLFALVLVGDGDDHGALGEADLVDSKAGHGADLGDDVAEVLVIDLVVGPRRSERFDAGIDILGGLRVLFDKVGTVFGLLDVVDGLVVRGRVSPLRSTARGRWGR